MIPQIRSAIMGALLLTTTAPAQQRAPVEPATQVPPDTIVYETTSWGRVTYHLEVHRDGRLHAWQQDFNSGARLAERDEQRGPALYEQALAALAPLSPALVVDCSGAPTDGPSGSFRWHDDRGPQAYGIYFGCYSVSPLPPGNAIARDATEAFFALTAQRTATTTP